MLSKLKWERDLAVNLGSTNTLEAIFALVNAFTTAWHLAEWTSYAVDPTSIATGGLGEYRADVVRRCPELRFCDQVANTVKHRQRLRGNDPGIIARSMVRSVLRRREDYAGPPVHLALVFDPRIRDAAGEHSAIAVIDTVIDFWAGELERLQLTRRVNHPPNG
ncbi:MAG TPA: hypothetical protein VGV17_24055 [Bosea sp. (in: a-proteobacteria)]|jgi:hypothetical protein|uniref:hypothetical protein n=1 Tax=Bosea sp. (in: a-proteobacteria) TaxID=1871050 RepID=UPI002DDD8752|nr:hypothetical protein [Bosea sp. (in: a-proteobacteria)]HEV2556837.1 hypothetical protein [Bosea sp. (in: a-proteobacteria)]